MRTFLQQRLQPLESIDSYLGGIGVFDSGRGGLSIVSAIRERLPTADILYIADEAYAPYGDRSEAEILARARTIGRLLQSTKPAALVIACNTATAVAVETLRQELQAPIIGVEPAVKPAVQLTKSGTIAVLATARTLQCYRFQRLLDRFAQQTKVLTSDCPGWVQLVEEGIPDCPETVATLERVVAPLLEAGADTFVLGCTHYPFLIEPLRKLLPVGVELINPAPAVARQLCHVIEQEQRIFSAGGALRCYRTVR